MASGAGAQTPPEALMRLHDALHLTADQEDAWRGYTAVIAPSPQATARRQATEQMLPQLTTPRRIALIDATMERDVADFRRQGDAVTAFYARLTPDQQAIFDRETVPTPGADQPRR
jgi:hypothetical protein